MGYSAPPLGIPFDVDTLRKRVEMCKHYPPVNLSAKALEMYHDIARQHGLEAPPNGEPAPEAKPLIAAHGLFKTRLEALQGTRISRASLNQLLDETLEAAPIADETAALQFRYLVHLALNGANRQQHLGR